MALPYAVVSFLDEGDFSDEDDDITSEVPTTWLTLNKTECWWPKTANVKPYIVKRISPVEGSRKWILCKVRLEGYYENLEKARSAAADKKSESESSSNLKQSNRPNLRKKKHHLPHVREDSAEREESPDSENTPHNTISEMPKLNPKKNSNQDKPEKPKSPRLSEKDSHAPSYSQTEISIGNNLVTSQITVDKSKAAIINQKNNNHLPSHAQTRIDIGNYMPIDFEMSDTSLNNPASLAPIQPQRDTNFPSHSRTGDSSLINLDVHDYDFDPETVLAGIASNVKSVRNSPPKASDIAQSASGQIIEGTSLLFDGTLTDLCDNANTRKLMNEHFAKLAEILAEMAMTQRSVNQRLSSIENKINVTGTARHREDFRKVKGDLPFKTTADMRTFEAKLVNPDSHRLFVQYVGQVGGNSPKENILRILRQVFTNSVAKDASWHGLRANFQLSNLKVIAAIKEGVRLSYDCTDKDFEETVSEWFRQGKQRFKRENQPKILQPPSTQNPSTDNSNKENSSK